MKSYRGTRLSSRKPVRSVLERLEQRNLFCYTHPSALVNTDSAAADPVVADPAVETDAQVAAAPIVAAAEPLFSLSVDAGSGTAYTDSTGRVWQADGGFSGGGTDTTAFPVGGTSDPRLFQTRRAGVFSYTRPVPDGNYTLNLLFADWRNPGERKFNVAAEGVTILSEFDISAAAGKNTALIRTFNITVTGGALNLSFSNGSAQTPTLSGFELFSGEATSAPLAPTNLQVSAGASSSINLSWSDLSSNNETGYEVERSTDGGQTFGPVVTNPANDTTYVDGGLSASTAYSFRVRAVNDAGVSDWSNVASTTTPANETPPPPNAGVDIKVDAGNGANFTDGSGNVWTADANFSGGWFASTNFAVANTNDDPLYLSRRAGDFTYSRAVPNGDYTLKLLFADYLTAGQRKFNVSAEGSAILTNYDIVADAGTKTAITKSFPVTVTDGKIDLSFTSVVNYATISALQLVAAGGGGSSSGVPAQPTNLTATAGVGKISLAWKDNASNEQSQEIWRQVNGGAITFLTSRPANATTYEDLNLDPAKTYTYFVRGINAVGASSPSFSATGKPLANSTNIAWTTGKTAPVTRAEAGGATVNGKLYVFGGFLNGQLQVTTQLDIYDPATNTWSLGAPCPAPTTHASTAVDGTTIWVAGFFYNNGVSASRLVYKYDTLTNTWSTGPQLPAPRGAGAMAIVGRELHFWGGLTGATSDAADHWRLNLDNTAAGWVTDTPVPQDINHHAGITLNGKIYSIGGMFDKLETTGNQSTVRVYDPATRTWSLAASLPFARGHIGPATFLRNGRIVIAGGSANGTDLLRDVIEYNPTSNSWTSLTQLPAARKSSVAGFINGKIIVTGGNAPAPNATTWIGT